MSAVAKKQATIRCPGCGKLNRARAAERGTLRCGSCQRPLPWLVEADEASFELEAKASVPVLLDLWAPWCGPCRSLAPLLQQLAEERAGKLKVVKVNVDHSPQLASRFDVQGIPLLVLMQDGQELDRLSGAAPLAALRDWVTQASGERVEQSSG